MPHKTREAIDEQQKQMQSSMTAEEIELQIFENFLEWYERKISKEELKQNIHTLINQFKKGIAREWFEKGLGEGIARKTVKGFDDTFEDYWNDFNQQ